MAHTRRYIKGETPQTRGYSPAVSIQGDAESWRRERLSHNNVIQRKD